MTYFLAKIPSFYDTIKCNRTVNVKTAPKSRREVRGVVYFLRKERASMSTVIDKC